MDLSQLSSHISQIVDALGRLAIDGESSVRRRSAQILTSLFATASDFYIFLCFSLFRQCVDIYLLIFCVLNWILGWRNTVVTILCSPWFLP